MYISVNANVNAYTHQSVGSGRDRFNFPPCMAFCQCRATPQLTFIQVAQSCKKATTV